MAETTAGGRLKPILALVAVLVVAALVLTVVVLDRGGDDGTDVVAVEDTTVDQGTVEEDGSGPCPTPANAPEPRLDPYDEPPAVDLDGVDTVTATIRTTCGTIEVVLDAMAAPTTVGNFVALAEDGYYAGVGFHRVIDGFMIQGGDPTGTGSGCVDAACSTRLPGYTFADELELAQSVTAETGGYPRGTLAMANAGPDTNGSQFFIVQASPGYPLPPQYAVFGEVTEGMDVVDRIVLGPVDGQLAVDPVRILEVEVAR